MSKSAESRITAAVSAAISDHVQNGTPPSEAVAKTAMSMGLSIPMAERATEIFNAAKTRAFLKTAEDKTATFPVADSREVVSLAFGSGLPAKTASAGPFMTSGFSSPVRKTASAGEAEPAAPPSPREIDRAVHALKTASEDARAEAGACETRFLETVKRASALVRGTEDWSGTAYLFREDPEAFCADWITEKIASWSGTPVPDIARHAREASCLYGPEADPVLLETLKRASAALRGIVVNEEASDIAMEMAESLYTLKTAAGPKPPAAPKPAAPKPAAPKPAAPKPAMAPAPARSPAPAPAPPRPAAPSPTPENITAFRGATGSEYKDSSALDRYNMDAVRSGRQTMSTKQWRASGQPAPAPQAPVSQAPVSQIPAPPVSRPQAVAPRVPTPPAPAPQAPVPAATSPAATSPAATRNREVNMEGPRSRLIGRGLNPVDGSPQGSLQGAERLRASGINPTDGSRIERPGGAAPKIGDIERRWVQNDGYPYIQKRVWSTIGPVPGWGRWETAPPEEQPEPEGSGRETNTRREDPVPHSKIGEAPHALKTAGPAPLPPPDKGKAEDKGKGDDKPSFGDGGAWNLVTGIPGRMGPHSARESSIAEGINGVYADAGKWGFERKRSAVPGGVAKLSPEEEGEQLVRQRIFLKLMGSDEILSQVDPAELARHYNTLVRIAPEVSLIPEASRGFLRNMVHSGGGIDLFTVEQAGKATGALQKATRPGERSANPAIGEIRDRQMGGAK